MKMSIENIFATLEDMVPGDVLDGEFGQKGYSKLYIEMDDDFEFGYWLNGKIGEEFYLSTAPESMKRFRAKLEKEWHSH